MVGFNRRVLGNQEKAPLLIVVGDKDGMLPLARDAESVFRDAGHHVEFGTSPCHNNFYTRSELSVDYLLDLVPDMGHEYRKEKEDSIWSFLSRYPRR